MSAIAVTDLPARTVAGTRPYGAPPTRLRSVATLEPAALEPVPERTKTPDDEVTVTVRVGAGTDPRNVPVLQALRQFLAAAGHEPDGAPVVRTEAVPGIAVDPQSRTVVRDGESLTLSRLEFDLLHFLARHPRHVFSRSQLLNQVWGHAHTGARTVDVHVSRLRTKLGAGSDVITTVYGVGYRLADDAGIRLHA